MEQLLSLVQSRQTVSGAFEADGNSVTMDANAELFEDLVAQMTLTTPQQENSAVISLSATATVLAPLAQPFPLHAAETDLPIQDLRTGEDQPKIPPPVGKEDATDLSFEDATLLTGSHQPTVLAPQPAQVALETALRTKTLTPQAASQPLDPAQPVAERVEFLGEPASPPQMQDLPSTATQPAPPVETPPRVEKVGKQTPLPHPDSRNGYEAQKIALSPQHEAPLPVSSTETPTLAVAREAKEALEEPANRPATPNAPRLATVTPTQDQHPAPSSIQEHTQMAPYGGQPAAQGEPDRVTQIHVTPLKAQTSHPTQDAPRTLKPRPEEQPQREKAEMIQSPSEPKPNALPNHPVKTAQELRHLPDWAQNPPKMSVKPEFQSEQAHANEPTKIATPNRPVEPLPERSESVQLAAFANNARLEVENDFRPGDLSEPLQIPGDKRAAPPTVFRGADSVMMPQMPRLNAQLIRAAAPLAPNSPVEISLSPEELGKVRMVLQPQNDGQMALTITVDRPETLDMMRRNLGMLADDFADMGYQGLNLSLQHQAENGAHSDQRRDNTTTTQTIEIDAHVSADADVLPVPRRSLQHGGVDIRI